MVEKCLICLEDFKADRLIEHIWLSHTTARGTCWCGLLVVGTDGPWQDEAVFLGGISLKMAVTSRTTLNAKWGDEWLSVRFAMQR